MDAPTRAPMSIRTGAAPMRSSGLGTFAFFGVIVLAVGLAGSLGVLFWGPDKTATSRTHLATDPPPPTPLPSLGDTDPAASATPSAVPVDPAPAEAASASKKKKGKKSRTR
jgi:hypothetical protein